MGEGAIVKVVVETLRGKGYKVATEVANFNRSADIAAIDPSGFVVVVECKMSNIRQALTQMRTHKHSADRLYIATPCRNMRSSTIEAIKDAGLGLFCVTLEGILNLEFEDGGTNHPWEPARDRLKRRIVEGA